MWRFAWRWVCRLNRYLIYKPNIRLNILSLAYKFCIQKGIQKGIQQMPFTGSLLLKTGRCCRLTGYPGKVLTYKVCSNPKASGSANIDVVRTNEQLKQAAQAWMLKRLRFWIRISNSIREKKALQRYRPLEEVVHVVYMRGMHMNAGIWTSIYAYGIHIMDAG